MMKLVIRLSFRRNRETSEIFIAVAGSILLSVFIATLVWQLLSSPTLAPLKRSL